MDLIAPILWTLVWLGLDRFTWATQVKNFGRDNHDAGYAAFVQWYQSRVSNRQFYLRRTAVYSIWLIGLAYFIWGIQ